MHIYDKGHKNLKFESKKTSPILNTLVSKNKLALKHKVVLYCYALGAGLIKVHANFHVVAKNATIVWFQSM